MRAFIFDLNGTMIDDMEYHTRGWMYTLNDILGGSFSWDEVKPQMYGKNRDLLIRMFGAQKFTDEEIERLSIQKEKRYQQEFFPHLQLLPGLMDFLEKSYQASIPMAIGSAAIPFNIDFVLDNLNIRHYFKSIVSANDVIFSKPHPETFLKAAQLLNVEPTECLVFEDGPKGAEAAQNAGMNAVVLTTTHQADEFKAFENVQHFADDFTDSFFNSLLNN